MFFFFFFFEEFEGFLKQCLYSDEHYERSKVIGDSMVDYFLPEGSRRLGYPPKTVIQVKDRITSGTTRSEKRASIYLRKEYGINQYVLISHNIPNEAIPLRSSKEKDDIFKLVNFDSLKASLEKYGTLLFEDDYQWQKRRDDIIERAAYDYQFGRNTFFLGSGVSQDAGLSSWEALLNSMISGLRDKKEVSVNDINALDKDCGTDCLLKGRYLKRLCAERDVAFVNLIRESLYRNGIHESELVNTIVNCIKSGKVSNVITYNYDDILERQLEKDGIQYFSVDGQNRADSYQFPIFHVHGFIPQEKDSSYDRNVVLSEDEYHALYNNAFHWSNIEQLHALVQTCCFFIGLSMKDPNLRRLLDIAQQRGTGVPTHYAFLIRKEYDQPRKAERIFNEMGVNVIWIEEYWELPGLIEKIVKKIKNDEQCP